MARRELAEIKIQNGSRENYNIVTYGENKPSVYLNRLTSFFIILQMLVHISLISAQELMSSGFPLSILYRRVHLATELLRPSSGRRPGRRQARHARILQIGLCLAIAHADARPAMPVSFR